MKKVIAIGELIVDMISLEKGKSLEKASSFQKAAGGAPANVACAVGQLGGRALIISRVGCDAFGDFLIGELEKCNVDTGCIFRTDKGNTPVAFISIDEKGERNFSFYHEPDYVRLLTPNMIDEKVFDGCAALHFGSAELSGAASRQAHKKAIEFARKKGALISFDPNIRPSLWQNQSELRSVISSFLPLTDIIKVSSDELHEISGTKSVEKSFNLLLEFGCRLIVYTRGDKGAEFIFPGNRRICVEGEKVPVMDATGAGDAFIGAVLYKLTEGNVTRAELPNLGESELKDILHFAAMYAAHTVTSYGAIASMATKSQFENFCKER